MYRYHIAAMYGRLQGGEGGGRFQATMMPRGARISVEIPRSVMYGRFFPKKYCTGVNFIPKPMRLKQSLES